MSNYTDYLIYAPKMLGREDVAYLGANAIVAQRNGHSVTLVRSKKAITVLPPFELLSTGHCAHDCPFTKLEGDALAKYQLAYDTQPREETVINEEGQEEVQIIAPPFRFGVFA